MQHEEPVEPRADEPEEVPTEPLLVVVAGERSCALPLEGVLEVVPARPYAALPGAPPAVRGVVNVRGRVITVVDLGAALDLPPSTTSPDHRVLVLDHAGRRIGVAVSEVTRIIRIPVADLVPVQEGSGEGGWVRATTRVQGREVAVLRTDALLSSILS